MQQRLPFIAFLFMVFASTLSGCKKETIRKSDKEITSFMIEASLNAEHLLRDVHAEIIDFEIRIGLPREIERAALTATFTHNGKRMLINTVEQQSQITVNGFIEPIHYTVEALDGSQQQYAVIIEEIEDTGLLFNLFSFDFESNSNLKEAPKTIHRGDSIIVRIKHDVNALVASFDTDAVKVSVNGAPQASGITVNDFSTPLNYVLTSSYGTEKEYTVVVERSSGIPHLYIETEGDASITSKETYLQAKIRIEGEGLYDDYLGTTGIRGRGNSTWTHPKKPYRLKLDKKASLFGLEAEKDWVLLSNYIDESLMLNAVAMKAGQLLGLPYTNTIIPVDLTINGKYLGSYMFTEQVEVEKNRVALDDGGVLLELDANFDEDNRFRSSMYGLPVMVKYPKEPLTAALDKIKKDFRQLENAMYSLAFPNTDYLDYIDADALVDYLILNTFTLNQEINHPKSVFLHKQDANAKYRMGPIWDFDWAFGYDKNQTHFTSPTEPVFVTNITLPGGVFFQRFLEDPKIRAVYKKKWDSFKQSKLPDLLLYVDMYSNQIEESAHLDYQVWGYGSADFPDTVQKFKEWLLARSDYMDSYTSNF